MTNIEKIVQTLHKRRDAKQKLYIIGDFTCRLLGCKKCPVSKDKTRAEPCVIRLGRWAVKEADDA